MTNYEALSCVKGWLFFSFPPGDYAWAASQSAVRVCVRVRDNLAVAVRRLVLRSGSLLRLPHTPQRRWTNALLGWVSLNQSCSASVVSACVLVCVTSLVTLHSLWFCVLGLTIDTVSSTNLIICIGVCVDYAAHVAHAFLHTGGKSRSTPSYEELPKSGYVLLAMSLLGYFVCVQYITATSRSPQTRTCV